MLRLAASLLVVMVFGASAYAQAPAEFYRGKQIRLVVGTATGQDYDLWARLIGRHLTRRIAGTPALIVGRRPHPRDQHPLQRRAARWHRDRDGVAQHDRRRGHGAPERSVRAGEG